MIKKLRNRLKNKCSQSEIVGFVVIVVIVVVIGLFLLVFYLKQDSIRVESTNAVNFLKASLEYTTSCNTSMEMLSIGDVMKRCYDGATCSNRKTSCEVLNETYYQILDETWKINSNRPVNYYKLDIYYRETEEDEENPDKEKIVKNEPILTIESGNCTGSRVGGQNFLHYRTNGNIVSDLEICYN
jgi:hypothetical protein